MDALRSIVFAFSMFSAIPMPQLKAPEGSGKYTLAMFPLVGLVVGAVDIGWWAICDALAFSAILKAVGLTLLPLAVTGGIHLDGLADVTDALASWAEPERRREILKDSHIGAFAAMGVAAYLICYFGFAEQLAEDGNLICAVLLGLGFVLSRAASGITANLFPKSTNKGMLASQLIDKSRTTSLVIMWILALCASIAMLIINWSAGVAMIVAVLLAVLILYRVAMTKFGGMSGDLSGFFTQIAELLMLIALVVIVKVIWL